MASGEGGAGLGTGAVLGRYVLLEPLGEGGMGVVYRAYDADLDRPVAIKLVHPGGENPGEARLRLVREARAMARVVHPNIVRVHDVGEVGGDVFIAVDLIEGSTLKEWLRARRRSLAEILDVFVRAGRGLAAAHDAELVHRDFKPDNVLCASDGGVFVTDFGLARETTGRSRPRERSVEGSGDVEITRVGEVVGTPAYMAPEQLRSGAIVDARADQFAFCVTLWEAVCGERPFQGESVDALLSAVMRHDLAPVPRGALPGWLRRTLLRGLQRSPADRHPSLESLLHELEAVPRRRRRAVVLGAAVALCVSAGAVSLWRARRDPCAGVGDRIATAWSDEQRERAEPGLAAALDSYTQAWADASARACAATRVYGEQSERVLAMRERCLEHARLRLAALVDAAPAASVLVQTRAAWSLPPPASCLRAPAPGEGSDRLAEAEAALALGRIDDAAAALEDAVASEDEVTRVEAELARASVHAARGDAAGSEAALHLAIQRADAIAHDIACARGWAALTVVAATDPARQADTHRLAELARAAADRAGDDRARADVEAALAQIVDADAAHDHLVQAAALRERVDGPRHPDVAALLQRDARVLIAADRASEAVATATRALAIAQDVFAGDADAVRDVRLVLAEALAAAGEHEAAAAQRERAGGRS